MQSLVGMRSAALIPPVSVLCVGSQKSRLSQEGKIRKYVSFWGNLKIILFFLHLGKKDSRKLPLQNLDAYFLISPK